MCEIRGNNNMLGMHCSEPRMSPAWRRIIFTPVRTVNTRVNDERVRERERDRESKEDRPEMWV